MKYIFFFYFLFYSQVLFCKVVTKDSINIESIDPILKIYKPMIFNRGVSFSVTSYDTTVTRLYISTNELNIEYVNPNLKDSIIKNEIVSSGINYDSLIILVNLMKQKNYCSLGLSGNHSNYSIHIGYKFNPVTLREYSYVFINDKSERLLADQNKSYVKIKEGVYMTSFIER